MTETERLRAAAKHYRDSAAAWKAPDLAALADLFDAIAESIDAKVTRLALAVADALGIGGIVGEVPMVNPLATPTDQASIVSGSADASGGAR